MRFLALAIVAAFMLSTGAPAALAQDYPARPVRLVNPFTAGAITSTMARLFAQHFQERTGQPMVVDHKPGAGTNLGAEMVAKAPPDGYTILLGTSSLSINPALYARMGYDPIKDLAPIVLLVRTPNVLAVSNKLPVQTVGELISHARAQPGKLNYASSGNGASNHLGMELFKSMTGLDMVHIPFKGGAEASTALLAGQVDLMFSPESTVGPHHKARTLRIIAVGGDRRLDSLPGIPTVAEAGVPGFDTGVWLGLFAPAGTSPAIIEKLNAEANSALKDPKIVQALNTAGLMPVGGTAEQMRTVLMADTTRLGKVVRDAGLRLE